MENKSKVFLRKVIVVIILITVVTSVSFKGSKAAGSHGLENPKVTYVTRDILEFGHYWQEDTNGDGVADKKDEKMPIRWQVIEPDDGEGVAILMSDMILDAKLFQPEDIEASWMDTSIRRWLTSSFFNNAFSSDEKAGIQLHRIDWDDEDEEVKDYVYVLNYDSFNRTEYDVGINERKQVNQAIVTEYAKNTGIEVSPDGAGAWLLRSNSCYVNSWGYHEDGYEYDDYLVEQPIGIRPVINVKLSDVSKYVKKVGKKNMAINATSWDSVIFGKYKGKELTWRVLKVSGDDAFVLADELVAVKDYHSEYEEDPIMWEDCSLRKWLNNEFYNSAFNSEEKKMIKDTRVVNEGNPIYGKAGGNDTTDKIYLLSLSDIVNTEYGFPNAYNDNSQTREAIYAFDEEYREAGSIGGWWLRTVGDSYNYVTAVDVEGFIYYDGLYMVGSEGIRPVMHIDLTSSEWKKGEKISTDMRYEDRWNYDDYYVDEQYDEDDWDDEDPNAGTTVTPVPQSTPVNNQPVTTIPSQQTVTSANSDNKLSGKNISITAVSCKKNAKKITGKLSVNGATVKVKVGKKAYKKATVKGKTFSLKLSYKLKKKTKISIMVSKKKYKTLKKTYVVK